MANYCHLSYEDRKNIEDGLNNKKSVNQIAKELNRSHSTILREIDRNKVYYKPSNWNNCYNDKNNDYSCNKLSKPPHVCNGCKSRSGCRKERFTYYARMDLCRESLNNNCPFKAMLFLCDENILNSLNMYYFEPDEVVLNNSLLK